jgi:hypothetical protein
MTGESKFDVFRKNYTTAHRYRKESAGTRRNPSVARPEPPSRMGDFERGGEEEIAASLGSTQ